MEKSFKQRIVNALLRSGLVDKDRLQNVLNKARIAKDEDIIRRITDSGIISERELLAILSRELNLPVIDLSRVNLDPQIIRMIPEKIARQYNVVPISRLGNNVTLAIFDPTDIMAIDDVKTVTRCDVSLVLATRQDLQRVLQQAYSITASETVSTILDAGAKAESEVEVIDTSLEMGVLDIMEKSKTAPIVKVVAVIISEAIKKRASDIHIEPQEKALRIRYRIDGELYDVFELPKKNQNAIIARLKIMSNLDITQTRIPQDGRFRIKLEDKEIDFRVSSLPTTFGNKIVLRALDKSNLSIGLETLGFLPGPLGDFKKALEMPYGIILVTGPTGSGKSTTLYSIVNELNVPERNVVTVENPIEYQVEGITQMATQPEIGLDFALGLRSILRQNPDVMMIGEIRDFETADIAIKSSLTGHMVLSTLHTNDAVGAITRLVNMGVEPFLIASSLIMACAQRLLRRICPHCKTEAHIPKEVLKDLADRYPEIKDTGKFYIGKGCSKCNNTGFLGRLGTLETLLVDDQIRDMINRECSEEDIKRYIRTIGFRTLKENAIIKFCKGWTTLEEVLRVT